MVKARRVRSGDRVAVVAPASPCPRDEFDRGVAEIRRLGFEPVYSPQVFERAMFTAGTAADRAADFVRAWSDPSVAALVAVRGGYGSVQMLPLLEALPAATQPKLFIGYSDPTAILSWLTCQQGVVGLHGPMLEKRLAAGPSGYDEASLLALLQDGRGFEMAPGGLEAIREGEASGPLFGGNLAQLAASLGTPYAFAPPDGCILFLEDVNERPYKLDRLLMQLRLGGVLAKARAVVLGEMAGCDEPGGTITARDVVREFARDCPGPVVFGFPSGHTAGPCWTLPLGVRVRVNTRPRPVLTIEESPVE